MVNEQVAAYARQRELLLERISETLSADKRFPAAWLTGSFGRNEPDDVSDLDLTLVVTDEYSGTLCSRPWQVGGQTILERYNLFSQFGEPAVIHENHHNAPAGGTFTFVLYTGSGLMVDWMLRPQAGSQRPPDSYLLWDQVGIPFEPAIEPASPEQRAQEASEAIAFFWMMAAVTAKYLIRGDGVFVTHWLETLTGLVEAVDRQINGRSWHYRRGSLTALRPAWASQLDALDELCQQMLKQMPLVVQMGGYVPAAPIAAIQPLLNLAREAGEATSNE